MTNVSFHLFHYWIIITIIAFFHLFSLPYLRSIFFLADTLGNLSVKSTTRKNYLLTKCSHKIEQVSYVLFVCFSHSFFYYWYVYVCMCMCICICFFRVHWSACLYVMQFIAWMWNDTPHIVHMPKHRQFYSAMCLVLKNRSCAFFSSRKNNKILEWWWYSILDFYFRC